MIGLQLAKASARWLILAGRTGKKSFSHYVIESLTNWSSAFAAQNINFSLPYPLKISMTQ